MKIAITGASGFVGSHLQRYFRERGEEVIPLSRADFMSGNEPLLRQKLEGCDAVVNLAGAPINVRWTEKNKAEILHSRVQVTRSLVNAINSLAKKPAVLVTTSAVGYYPSEGIQTERSASDPHSFLAEVTRQWEAAAEGVSPQVRLVVLRFGVVLGNDGGMLPVLLKSFSKRVGVMFGPGTQPFSWIHIDDLVAVIGKATSDPSYSGVYNCVSPHPVDFEELTAQIGYYYKPYIRVQLPSFLLKMILLEGASLILQGQHVLPERLLEKGFRYQYPTLPDALQALLGRGIKAPIQKSE